MSRQCELCGKDYHTAVKRVLLRGNLNPTKKNKQQPNLQTKTIPVTITKNGETKTQLKKVKRVCTRCIRTMVKPPRIRKKKEIKKEEKITA